MNISYVWGVIKKFSNQKINTAFSNKLPDSNMAKFILEKITVCDINPDFELSNETNYSKPFQINELHISLRLRKKSAPGRDNIPYIMFLNLPEIMKFKLLEVYNQILKGHRLPQDWKEYIILGILKENRKADNFNNFRPIALQACGLKLLEKMIKNRIEWYIEHNQILSPLQTGFRRGQGIMDAVAYVVTYVQTAFGQNQMAVAVLLDIKGAYDNINLSKLHSYLIHYGIQDDLANLIFRIFNNRLTYVLDNEDNLHGPGLATRGLPQGSPLSPVLFNIYLRSLYDVVPSSSKLIAYADDLILLVKGNNIKVMENEINCTLHKIKKWMDKHQLQMAIQKCDAIWFFNNKKVKHNLTISIDSYNLSVKKEVKYLGVTITHNLKWDTHINNIIKRANQGINVIRCFSRVWWGADPKCLLMAFNGLVKTHLDFGSILFQPSTKKNLCKLNTVFYQGLRAVTGTMKSTPTNALLAETGETSLEFRRKWLATKFVLIRVDHTAPIIDLLESLSDICKNKQGYWKNREIPYLVSALEYIYPVRNQIYFNEIIPAFSFEYDIYIHNIQQIHPNIQKNDPLCRIKFNNFSENYAEYNLVFTDASKMQNRVGIGVAIPQRDISFTARVHEHLTICDAELIAIHKGITMCLEKNISKNIIITDSLSAINRIKSHHISAKSDYISMTIKQMIYLSSINNVVFKLAWVPGHSKIDGNEKADSLAKLGTTLNIPLNIKPDKYSLMPFFQSNIKEEFYRSWKQDIQQKGKMYHLIHEEYPKDTWYLKYPYMDRRHITSIIRMKTGHCTNKEHLYRLKIVDNPNCECGMRDTLNHIFFECPINKTDNKDLYKELILKGIATPFSITTVLRQLNIPILKALIKFIDQNKIKL
ncbi:uncharacterized protein [Leptinotarsa decemlineata]|uniref:uncharacterized protein n=1 Tax=Leptinotarsa decemlineata TaxID=7539 RepID=UPI003D306C4E